MAHTSIYPAELKSVLDEDYDVLERLGQGAYSTVFKAIQTSTGQAVAIKVQRLDRDSDAASYPNRIGRFERETKLCAAINHPHIVRILDKGRRGEYLFIVFEFVPGETLGQLLARHGALPPREAVALMSQVLDALDGAHALGIIHRDLKPDNIMVVSTAAQRHAKVLDFGVGAFVAQASEGSATITRSQEIVGTPCYSAPEQLRGEPATSKSDIFAWGLVLLECLTGKRVVDGATMAQVFHKQLSALEIPLPGPIATHPLGDILRRALTKSARDRTGDAGRLWMELRRVRLDDLIGPLVSEATARFSGPPGTYATAERRQATVLACSLNVHSISRSSADIETLDAIHRDQLNFCADVVARFGGQVMGLLADRMIAIFGLPHAGDNHARRAGRAALELASKIEARRPLLSAQRGIDLELRVGIHTDMVIVNPDGSTSGPALHVAARLEGMAKHGSGLVSEATRNLLHKYMRLRRADTLVQREASIEVYALEAEDVNDGVSFGATPDQSASLVGRRAELETLVEHWTRARTGHGSVIVLRGEPGIGKTRLLQELGARARQDGALTLEGQCLPEDGHSALHPILGMVRRYLELDRTIPESGLNRLRADLAGSGVDIDSLIDILGSWLGLHEAEPSTAQLSAERQRHILLEGLAQVLCSAGGEEGAFIALEDLHWADPTTLDLVSRIVGHAQKKPVFLLVTARPEFGPLPEHAKVLHLQGLDKSAVELLIAQCAQGDATVTEGVVADIVQRTDGVPLFVEELTRHFLERREWSSSTSIPSGLQGVLNGRLDRLGPAKETAQLAAAIGREFGLDLLGSISLRAVDALQADLDALVDAQLLRRQPQSSGSKYVFRHALIREAAWESMLTSQRRAVHLTIATTLESRFEALIKSEPARLALHFAFAGAAEKAIEYYLTAGRKAAQASAYQEAMANLGEGIALLPQVVSEGVRYSLELDLRNTLGGALIASQGFATDAVVQTFTRSRDLLRVAVPSALQRLMTLKGLWTFHNARADYAAAGEIAEQLLQLAADHDRPEFQLVALESACQTSLLTGRFEAAVEYGTRCDRWFDPALQRECIAQYGVDPWLSTLSHESIAHVALGRVRRARQRLARGLEAATELASPSQQALLLCQVAWVELLLSSCGATSSRALAGCIDNGRAAVEIAEKYGLIFCAGYGKLLLAMAGSLTGDEQSLLGVKQAAEIWRFSGVEAFLSWPSTFLAQGHLARREYGPALKWANDALEHCQRTGEDYAKSEALRLLAQVLGDPANPNADPIRSSWAHEQALEVAKSQSAHWFYLRAAYTRATYVVGEARENAVRDLIGSLQWFQREDEPADMPLIQAGTRLTETAALAKSSWQKNQGTLLLSEPDALDKRASRQTTE